MAAVAGLAGAVAYIWEAEADSALWVLSSELLLWVIALCVSQVAAGSCCWRMLVAFAYVWEAVGDTAPHSGSSVLMVSLSFSCRSRVAAVAKVLARSQHQLQLRVLQTWSMMAALLRSSRVALARFVLWDLRAPRVAQLTIEHTPKRWSQPPSHTLPVSNCAVTASTLHH